MLFESRLTSVRLSVFSWCPAAVSDVESGLDAGPLVLFKDSSRDVIVLSHFNEFMTQSTVYSATDTVPSLSDGTVPTVSWGLMGHMQSIDEMFETWSILSYSAHGINEVY